MFLKTTKFYWNTDCATDIKLTYSIIIYLYYFNTKQKVFSLQTQYIKYKAYEYYIHQYLYRFFKIAKNISR